MQRRVLRWCAMVDAAKCSERSPFPSKPGIPASLNPALPPREKGSLVSMGGCCTAYKSALRRDKNSHFSTRNFEKVTSSRI